MYLGLELGLLDEHVEPREEQLGVLAEQVVRLERVVLADDVLDQDARVRLLVVLEEQSDLAPASRTNRLSLRPGGAPEASLAQEYASGCLKLGRASAHQPLGPLWPTTATPGLLFTWSGASAAWRGWPSSA